jgi:mannose-6-phosphate isomerase
MPDDEVPAFDPSGFSLEPRRRRIDKPWGFEVLLSPEDAPYTAKLIHVRAGQRLSLQVHDTKVETQTLVEGRGVLVLEGADGELHDIEMERGVGYHVAIGQRHRLWAAFDDDAVVFEASTPELGTTYRLADDYARPHETEQLRQAERR